MEITHRADPDDGHMIQIVGPACLTRMLREQGETLDRPRDFGERDEWLVLGEAEEKWGSPPPDED